MTRHEIQTILRKEYDRQGWVQVLHEILPGTDVFASPQTVAVSVPDAPQAVQLARVRLGDRKQLAVLEVRVGERIDLLHNRVGLRNLVARFIDQAEYHGVLAVFLSPQDDFRFTFAARMAEFDEEGNLVGRETAPRRYTYVLGPNESCRTAAERFLHLSEKALSATMEDVIEAFSVEKLNKEFFADFCRAFDRVSKDIHKHHPKWSEVEVEREAQTLLDRLVFLYFVQRKGWLNRQRDYLLRNFQEPHAGKPGDTFMQQFLRPLFVKLSTEGQQADIPGHDLPFLNGGLFNDEYGDENTEDSSRRRADLLVANDTFAYVFENLLERYNFTIHEDSPTNQEVAIDPEMLGKIFEALVLQIEQSTTGGKSLRHDTGSHYTPRPIVQYLCVAALAGWLENQPPFATKANARERISKLLSIDISEGIDEQERAALNEHLTPEEAAVLLDRLATLRACDPAVGSGAFPMGLLRELLNLARLCETRARGQDPVEGERAWLYETKKRIIERVIYGVDLQERAIEICKLRLWLSLMVDHNLGVDPANCDTRSFRKALTDLEPLPNLDFKIRRADSLVDKIHGEPIPLGKIHVGSQAQQALNELTAAKREFYAAERAAEKRHLRLAIYKATAELAQIELTAARNELGLIPDPANSGKVAELDRGQREIGQVLARIRDVEKQQKAKRISVAGIEQALADIRDFFDNAAKPTFVWHLDFAEVFFRAEQLHANADGALPLTPSTTGKERRALDGFDIVLANPPYVRQELLAAHKPWLQAQYETFHGMADLYVYFYELGMRVLRPGGLLSFIVTNKWMKAGYGEPLRRFFKDKAWVRTVVDFGHAKQIFEEADVFPSIVVVQKPVANAPKPKTARLCTIPREQLRIEDLNLQIASEGVDMDLAQLSPDGWQLESKEVYSLLAKLCKAGIALPEAVKCEPLRGVLTGLNEAYIIDSKTKERIVAADPSCATLIRPNLRGQDFSRWNAAWAGTWLICLESSENREWPWSESDGRAEQVFSKTYPALHKHLSQVRDALIKRQDQGRFWWELRSCSYWADFGKKKIMFPEITWRPEWCFDATGMVCNNTAYILPADDLWVLAVANAPITWWFAWRKALHGKDEALRFIKDFVRTLPVPPPTSTQRSVATESVRRLLDMTTLQQQTQRTLLDWLRADFGIEKPSNRLQAVSELDADTLVSEVERVRGRKLPLDAASEKRLREEYTSTIVPARALAAEMYQLECALSDLVNQAYGLTPVEIELMWKTSPPRMPITPPAA
ncbi:MAG: Eco57I restriction-modification methylase domain-containing protein [Limisphaerales bacterium]